MSFDANAAVPAAEQRRPAALRASRATDSVVLRLYWRRSIPHDRRRFTMSGTNPVDPIFHGLGLDYDKGSIPAVGLTRMGTVLEVHKNEHGYKLWCRLGLLNKATIDWKKSKYYGDGTQ